MDEIVFINVHYKYSLSKMTSKSIVFLKKIGKKMHTEKFSSYMENEASLFEKQ